MYKNKNLEILKKELETMTPTERKLVQAIGGVVLEALPLEDDGVYVSVIRKRVKHIVKLTLASALSS